MPCKLRCYALNIHVSNMHIANVHAYLEREGLSFLYSNCKKYGMLENVKSISQMSRPVIIFLFFVLKEAIYTKIYL